MTEESSTGSKDSPQSTNGLHQIDTRSQLSWLWRALVNAKRWYNQRLACINGAYLKIFRVLISSRSATGSSVNTESIRLTGNEASCLAECTVYTHTFSSRSAASCTARGSRYLISRCIDVSPIVSSVSVATPDVCLRRGPVQATVAGDESFEWRRARMKTHGPATITILTHRVLPVRPLLHARPAGHAL